MPSSRVVVNASPLICLAKSGQLDLLPQLYAEILVPAAVQAEVRDGDGWPEIERRIAVSPYVLAAPGALDPRVLAWDLGPGETSVLTVVLRRPQYQAILDDRMARSCARIEGCSYTGTVGVLVRAKREGLIVSLREGLEKLNKAGLWISKPFVDELLVRMGE